MNIPIPIKKLRKLEFHEALVDGVKTSCYGTPNEAINDLQDCKGIGLTQVLARRCFDERYFYIVEGETVAYLPIPEGYYPINYGETFFNNDYCVSYNDVRQCIHDIANFKNTSRWYRAGANGLYIDDLAISNIVIRRIPEPIKPIERKEELKKINTSYKYDFYQKPIEVNMNLENTGLGSLYDED